MRKLVGSVGAIVTMFALAGCGASTAPTAPAAVPVSPNGFGVIIEAGASTATSFSACLSGSAAASCFSAPRIRAGNVTASAATAPSAPLNLVASSAGSSVTLTWSAPSSGDAVTSYMIEAGSFPGAANLANFSTGNTLTIFQASGIGAGAYYVRLRAANTFGTSAQSNEAILVVGASPGVAPGAPSGLTTTVNSGGTVGFAWNAASGSPTSYIIEAGSQPGLANLANSDLGSAATTMTASGVGAGTYYVRVRAKNAYGISPPSNEVTLVVVAVAPPPTGPLEMRANIDGVPWTAVNANAYRTNGGISVGGSSSTWTLDFNFFPTGPGTYLIPDVGLSFVFLVSNANQQPGRIAPQWQSHLNNSPGVGGGGGSVSLTTLTATGAAGTFSFTLGPYLYTGATGNKTITGGVFNVIFR